MDFDHRIASDRGSSFLALGPGGNERIVVAAPALPRPAVGDYVCVDADDRIRALAPRRGVLARARADRGNAAQIVAAHLDVAFVVTAPGRDFSPGRVERYLAAALAGGIAPVVILNKGDLADDLAALCVELAAVAGDAPVHALSVLTGDGCDVLERYARRDATLAVVGSSGVGKSTLANRLVGEDRFATGAIRAADGRGKHTTTARELIALPSGAWLIDTPGMRAFSPWASEDAVADVFGEIDRLATSCRFRDCAHGGEPGCAVVAGVDAGRLARWRALRAEIAYLDRRDDPVLRAESKKRWKRIAQAQRKRLRE